MINYGEVYESVSSFLSTRAGLNNPKKCSNFEWFVRDFTGILCGVSQENSLPSTEILSFLALVRDHELTPIRCDGQLNDVSSLIKPNVLGHRLYKLTERALMYFKPGNTQVGPGEFFMCFYDKDSRYGVDNTCGYDVLLDNVTTEMKSYGSNFTDEELLDGYAVSDKVERLLVVKPVSDAKEPRERSKYICCNTTDWRKYFTHVGKNGTLVLL
jgi:hypothetical protein